MQAKIKIARSHKKAHFNKLSQKQIYHSFNTLIKKRQVKNNVKQQNKKHVFMHNTYTCKQKYITNQHVSQFAYIHLVKCIPKVKILSVEYSTQKHINKINMSKRTKNVYINNMV